MCAGTVLHMICLLHQNLRMCLNHLRFLRSGAALIVSVMTPGSGGLPGSGRNSWRRAPGTAL